MTGDLVTHGPDRPPRRTGLLVGLAAVAVLAAGVYANGHGGDRPRAAASPSPSVSVPPLATVSPFTSFVGEEPQPDPFASPVTVRKPTRHVTPVLLPTGRPGFLVVSGRDTFAFAAAAGPDSAPRLLGWCAASRTFEDPAGEFRADENGIGYGGSNDLEQYPVRPNPRDPARLDIGTESFTPVGGHPPGPPRDPPPRACRRASSLLMPLLPRRVARFDVGPSFQTVRGRYVVATQYRAFCDSSVAGPCDQTNATVSEGGGALDPSDLAASYTYDGDFAVLFDPARPGMEVVLLPGARLVRREGVGVRARCGELLAVTGTGRTAKVRLRVLRDEVDFPVRADVVVVAPIEVGHPDLEYLRPLPRNAPGTTLCAILDASGRALRLVVENLPID